MTKKSGRRRAREDGTKSPAETFISNEAMYQRTVGYLRSIWGEHLTELEIVSRVRTLPAEEREAIGHAVLGRAVALTRLE